MKKILAIFMVAILLLAAGCTKKEGTNDSGGMNTVEASDLSGETKATNGLDAGATVDATVETGASTAEPKDDRGDSASADFAESFAGASTFEGKEDVMSAPMKDDIAKVQIDHEVTAGLLTAGEWNDNENWGFFANLVSGGHLQFPSFQLSPLNRVVVNVTNSSGPVKNANVILYDQVGNALWEAVTNYQGIAHTFYQVSDSIGMPASVKVSKDGRTETAAVILKPSQSSNTEQNDGQNDGKQQVNTAIANSCEVSVTLESTSDKKALDIMFIFDTTGSMGDELLYLQKEFEDIAKKVSDQNTRFSVNFYRDDYDDYVVNSNDFTTDINEVMLQLNRESASGGGDYEEAVDRALYNGICEHSWNRDSVKLLFIILDAPPHSNDARINDTLKTAITEAAKQGIRIIPIASSGVDKQTETFLRTSAILTGGTYTFLTDDSGIGNSHLEPTIGSYDVELLNDCIVRLIKMYYQ